MDPAVGVGDVAIVESLCAIKIGEVFCDRRSGAHDRFDDWVGANGQSQGHRLEKEAHARPAIKIVDLVDKRVDHSDPPRQLNSAAVLFQLHYFVAKGPKLFDRGAFQDCLPLFINQCIAPELIQGHDKSIDASAVSCIVIYFLWIEEQQFPFH